VENGLDPALPGCALTVLLEAAFTATMAAGGSFALLCAEDTGEMTCGVLCVVVVTNRNRRATRRRKFQKLTAECVSAEKCNC